VQGVGLRFIGLEYRVSFIGLPAAAAAAAAAAAERID
jgi:hypothetical protein